MNKKIFIILGVVVVFVLGAYFWGNKNKQVVKVSKVNEERTEIVENKETVPLESINRRIAGQNQAAISESEYTSDELTFVDCLAMNKPLDSKTWQEGDSRVYKCADQPAKALDYPLPDGSCRNPIIPLSCFDGTGQGAALYEDASGCLKYKCLKGVCAFNAVPRIINCQANDTFRPTADYWWDQEGCFSVCAGTDRAAWVNTPINNLCLDEPELSFTGYFPNEAFYPEYYRRDGAIQQAAKVQRVEKRCSDDKEVKKYELWLKAINDKGAKQTYCNFICRGRKTEQCVLDGTADTYVDEWCLDQNGNRINPDNPAVAAVCPVAKKPVCASGTKVYEYTDYTGCEKYACTPTSVERYD